MLKKLLIAGILCLSVSLTNNYLASAETLEEQIKEEIRQGEMELLAQLVQAEAGNQSLEGKRLVADVVLNRMEDERFPSTMEGVIFQINPVQFTCTVNGGFHKAGWNVTEEDFLAARLEYEAAKRMNEDIIFFSRGKGNGRNFFKVGDHWFSS